MLFVRMVDAGGGVLGDFFAVKAEVEGGDPVVHSAVFVVVGGKIADGDNAIADALCDGTRQRLRLARREHELTGHGEARKKGTDDDDEDADMENMRRKKLRHVLPRENVAAEGCLMGAELL